jgi:regulatory protein
VARDPAAQVWQTAVRLLAVRDRSEQELRALLAARGARPARIDAAVARLRELHYLDDARLAQTLAEAAAQRGHGSAYVRQRLAERGVAEPLVEGAVAAAFTDEAALARRVLVQRYGAVPVEPAACARAARFLAGRGFPEAVVLAILGEGC